LSLAVAGNARDGETTSLHSRLFAYKKPNARNLKHSPRALGERILWKKFFEHQKLVMSRHQIDVLFVFSLHQLVLCRY
jgi:hypothetical protein